MADFDSKPIQAKIIISGTLVFTNDSGEVVGEVAFKSADIVVDSSEGNENGKLGE